jgi:hypothetical protein
MRMNSEPIGEASLSWVESCPICLESPSEETVASHNGQPFFTIHGCGHSIGWCCEPRARTNAASSRKDIDIAGCRKLICPICRQVEKYTYEELEAKVQFLRRELAKTNQEEDGAIVIPPVHRRPVYVRPPEHVLRQQWRQRKYHEAELPPAGAKRLCACYGCSNRYIETKRRCECGRACCRACKQCDLCANRPV